MISDDELYCTNAAGSSFVSRIGSNCQAPGFVTSGTSGYWSTAVNLTSALLEVDFPNLNELQSVDMIFNNPLQSGALPLAVGIEVTLDSVIWTPVLFFAQNCTSFASRPPFITCVSTGTNRELTAPLPVSGTGGYLPATKVRLRLYPSSSTISMQVRAFTSF